MKTKRIEISHKTIIFTVLFLLSLFILWQAKSIIILLFISFIFMEAINPAISRLEQFKIPRPLAIIILYLIILTAFSFVIAGIIPILIEQTAGLVNSLPKIVENTTIFGTTAIDFSSQFKILENIPSSITKLAVGTVTNIFSGFIIFFVTFYLLIEKKNFSRYGQELFGEKGQTKFLTIINQLEARLGSWVIAQLFLMVIIGVLSYFGYLALGLKYAVPLAILAGLLEAVPTIGPTIATIVAGLVALTISPLTALLTVIWGIIIQQLENSYIVPKVMNKTVGFNPLMTIVLIAVGATLAGVIGAILVIPLYLTIEVIYKVISQKELQKVPEKEPQKS